MGVSPANTEAIVRWKDLVLVRELREKSADGPAAAAAAAPEKEDMFVFSVTIHQDGHVDVEPWDDDIEC